MCCEGFIPGFTFLGEGLLGDLYRLGGDLLSVGVLVGMVALIIRRFIFKPATLTTRQDVLLQPQARFGIRRDSAIVSALHPAARGLALHRELRSSWRWRAATPGSRSPRRSASAVGRAEPERR